MVGYGDKLGVDLSILKTVLKSNEQMVKQNG
jgi:hypothetical protein